MRTHQQSGVEWSGVEWSRVESSGVESSRVESSRVEWSRVEWSRVESSRVELSLVEPHKSCWVKCPDAACFIAGSQTPKTGVRAAVWRWEFNLEKLILLSKDRQALRCLSFDHWNRDYIASVWVKIAQEMGVCRLSTLVLCCLFWWWWWQ
jgi:hypothetical protein